MELGALLRLDVGGLRSLGLGTIPLWQMVLERRSWLVLVAWAAVVGPFLEPGLGWFLRVGQRRNRLGGSCSLRDLS
jgi:hypothetical protein